MKTWSRGWRIVLKCNQCDSTIWAKNVGETVFCDCDKPKELYEDAARYWATKGSELTLEKKEEAY